MRDNIEVEGTSKGEEKSSVSDWTANFLVKTNRVIWLNFQMLDLSVGTFLPKLDQVNL